jgi:hypothetical protein
MRRKNLRAKPDREWTRISSTNAREEKRQTADESTFAKEQPVIENRKSYGEISCGFTQIKRGDGGR